MGTLLKTSLAQKFFVLIADRGIQLLSQLFNIFILAKYLGPGSFGILLYALSVYGFLLGISNVGMERVLVIELSHHTGKEKDAGIMMSGILVKVLSSLLLLCLVLMGKGVITSFMSGAVYNIVAVLSLSLLFSSWVVVDAFNQSRENFRFTAFSRMSAALLALGARMIMVLCNATFEAIVLTFVAEQAVCLIVGLCISRGFFDVLRLGRFGNVLQSAAGIVKAGLLVMASTVCIIIYMRISQGVIEQKFSKAFLGIYSLAIYLIEVPISLASVMSTVFTPGLTKNIAAKEDSDAFAERVLKLFILVSLLSMLAILLTGVMLQAFLGKAYDGFLSTLAKAMISLPLLFAGYFFNIYLLCSKRFRQFLFVTFGGAAASLLFIFVARNYVTESTAVFLYVGTQVLASVIVPLLLSKSLRGITLKVISSFNFKSPVQDLRPLFYPKY